MLRGCLGSLVLLGILVGGYYWWLDQVFEPPESIVAAGVVGFIAFCCLGALLNARRAWKDWSLASLARHEMPPVDGRLSAVAGTIHPLDEPLIAPFSGEECVVCEYDVASQKRVASSKNNETTGSDYAGFLMTPSVIRTRLGEVRLVGYPLLTGFDEQQRFDYLSARNACEFLARNAMEDRAGIKIVSVLSVFGDVWSDDDGAVRKNMRLGKADLGEMFPPELLETFERLEEEQRVNPKAAARRYRAAYDETQDEDFDEDAEEDLDDDEEQAFGSGAVGIPKLTEKLVPVGAQVVAIGVYDEMRRGLRPPSRGRHPNRLIRGTAEQLERASRRSVKSNLLGGVLVLVLLNAGVYGVMQAYLHHPDSIRKRQERVHEAVVQGDVKALDALARRGLDVNQKNEAGQTLLMATRDPAVTRWLIEHGADVNAVDNEGHTALMLAARFNLLEIVKQLIKAKADLNARSPKLRRTALIEADNSMNFAVAHLLRQAGAEDDVVSHHNGAALPSDGGPQLAAVKQYLEALRAEDVPRLRQLIASDNGSTFEGGDWQLWRDVHLATITAFEGFTRDDNATLTAFGQSGKDFTTSWTYQLRREEGQWKVVRERWNVR